jgi:hypothetical protein
VPWAFNHQNWKKRANAPEKSRAFRQRHAARKTGPVIRIAIARTSAENLMTALLAEARAIIKRIKPPAAVTW